LLIVFYLAIRQILRNIFKNSVVWKFFLENHRYDVLIFCPRQPRQKRKKAQYFDMCRPTV